MQETTNTNTNIAQVQEGNSFDYKASLKEWMRQHGLGRQDVRDILWQMRLDSLARPIVKTAEEREFEEAYRQHEEKTHR
jgi:hypothetical protein